MIDHVTISVCDLKKSRSFYEQAFAPFSYKVIFSDEQRFWAFDIELFLKSLNIKIPTN
jgi:catechol 2,3-dioxygenase-like lactoylglutathione lyase family enzyme